MTQTINMQFASAFAALITAALFVSASVVPALV